MSRKKAKILIVDDNEDILISLRILLKQHFTEVITLKNPNQIPYTMENESFDLILLDMNFQAGINTGNEGIYWMNKILEQDPNAIIILITAYGDVELAVKAIKQGATDFILKPWENEKLLSSLMTAYKLRQSKVEIKNLKNKQQTLSADIDKKFTDFIGNSPAMKEIFKTISKVAKTDANVLIMGENGTGKELVARELHRQSNRASEVFISVDMSAISESLFESELFGAMKGSYTDSKEDRTGRFEVASGGSLFLDEIGNLSMPLQAKILTALQNREVTRLGSSKPIPIDIRLICATNKGLYDMVAEDNFREDLLYRINTIQIELPPLRDRREDIPVLANYFIEKYGRKYGKPKLNLGKQAIDKLVKYHWPGNVRELQHTMEKAVIMVEGDFVTPDDFLFHPTKRPKEIEPETLNLAEVEKVIILKAMEKHKGNISNISKDLGITRTTLYNKIEKYGI